MRSSLIGSELTIAFPPAEPELSLLCSETMRNRKTYQRDRSMYLYAKSIGGPIPPLEDDSPTFKQVVDFLVRVEK
jgi:hypothetical protein